MSTQTVVKGKKVVASTTKKVSEYSKQVIATNKALRTTHKTLGGCLKNMWFFRDDMNLTHKQTAVVKLLRTDDKAYTAFQNVCRKSKTGSYSPFFVLQAIYKASKVENAPKKTKK
jgi:hypothetical protein